MIVVTAYIYIQLKKNVITTEYPVLNKIEINARILTIYQKDCCDQKGNCCTISILL